MRPQRTGHCLALLLAAVASNPSLAGQPTGASIMVSGNDAKSARINGAYVTDPAAAPDTLVVLDAGRFPPRIIGQVTVHHSVSAPPTAVALAPGGKLALLAAPNKSDPQDPTQLIAESFLQVIGIDGARTSLIKQIALPHQPLSVAINKAGTLALTVQSEGEISALSIQHNDVELLATTAIGNAQSRSSGVAITPDSRWALVTLRGEDKLAVLAIEAGAPAAQSAGTGAGPAGAHTAGSAPAARATLTVSAPKYDLPTGHNPYVVKIAPNGRFAVVANVSQSKQDRAAGEDSVTFIDLTAQPFKVSATLPVPSGAEGLAISPDSRWVAVSSINGSNANSDSPTFHDHGVLSLLSMHDGKPTPAGTANTGHNSQGIEFTPDGHHLLVQDYVESVLSAYEISPRGPVATATRIPMPGHPASIAVAP